MNILGRIILTALAFLLALVIFVAIFAESCWVRETLADKISQRMDGRDVTIGDLTIDWGFPISVAATNMMIANPDWATHAQMISVPRLEVTLKVAPLFRGELALTTVTMEALRRHHERRATTRVSSACNENDQPLRSHSR